jgi:hypothetical protein
MGRGFGGVGPVGMVVALLVVKEIVMDKKMIFFMVMIVGMGMMCAWGLEVTLGNGKVNLSVSGGQGAVRNVHPEILVLGSGDVLVLWESGIDKRQNDIVYRIRDHQTGRWHPPLEAKPAVAAPAIRNAQYPQAVEDSQGVVHVSYMDGDASNNRDIYYIHYQKGSWSQPQNVRATPVNSAWPRITIDPQTDDLYITWQHVLNNGYGGKDIVYVKKNKGSATWGEMQNLSKTSHTQSIHQTAVFTQGRLQAVWMDGFSALDQWGLAAGWAGREGTAGETVMLIQPVTAHQPQWPEMAVDSQGNILGIFCQREAALQYLFKPANSGAWDAGFLADHGGITFFGVTVAKNDVAYAMYRKPAGSGYLPVYVRFTRGNVSRPEIIDHAPAANPWMGHMDMAVDLRGHLHTVWSEGVKSHEPTAVWYKRLSQPTAAPVVKINVEEIKGNRVSLRGEILSSTHKVVNYRWYIHDPRVWAAGQQLTVTFPEEGFYEVHYAVADADNLYGHDSVVVAIKEVSRPPRNPRIQTIYHDKGVE